MTERRIISLFSLIELLVVISIIIVIASMLVPALSAAKAKAMSITCAANMKQLQGALMLYMNDNEDFYPPVHNKMSSITWNGMTRTNAYLPWHSVTLAGTYFGNQNIASTAFPESRQSCTTDAGFCPVGRRDVGFPGNKLWIGYNDSDWPKNNFNSGLVDGARNPSDTRIWRRVSAASDPAKVFSLIDVKKEYKWAKFNLTENHGWSMRHQGKANLSFLDGHVDITSDLRFDYLQGRLTPQMK